ncbi:MAG: type II CAAX endopeptidase family protein [Myxococcota bacterium]
MAEGPSEAPQDAGSDSTPPGGSQPRPEDRGLAGLFATYLAVTATLFAITRLRGLPWMDEVVSLAVAALFLFVAIARVGYALAPLQAHGMALGGLLAPAPPGEGPAVFDLFRLLRENGASILRETAVALALATLIFPPFIFAFGYWNGLSGWPALRMPPEFIAFSLAQIVAVAIPEEAFFRGYMQTRLRGRLPLWSTLILQSAAFAFVHLAVDGQPARLAVFFPGLLFGLLRAWRGGIGAAVVFHALCNMLAEYLRHAWLLP